MITKLLDFVKSHQYLFFLFACGVLIAIIAFNLGRIYVPERPKLILEDNPALFLNAFDGPENQAQKDGAGAVIPTITKKPVPTKDPRVVASKNSDKYHHIYCASANGIKEENKIWFNSAVDAEKAGYGLAGNCKP